MRCLTALHSLSCQLTQSSHHAADVQADVTLYDKDTTGEHVFVSAAGCVGNLWQCFAQLVQPACLLLQVPVPL